MFYINQYNTWVAEYNRALMQARRNRQRKRLLVAVAAHVISKEKEKKKYERKKFWVHPIYQLRKGHGFYHAIFPTLCLEEIKFRNYFRMTAAQFEELLCLVAPIITKQTVVREPIPAAARLAMSLRLVQSIPFIP